MRKGKRDFWGGQRKRNVSKSRNAGVNRLKDKNQRKGERAQNEGI